jgi:two-component system, OmpR family, alkaline phosphatase synthesis response regulator PhoP
MEAINYNNNKILIIDDERDLLDLLATYLSKEGFKDIFKAENGTKGIELCKKEKPDIVILDVMLPDIDGFEVCRKLREFTVTPILFLSAREEEVDKLLGLGIGGDDYITKPFSPKEVTFRIKAQLRRKQYLERANTKVEMKSVVYNFGDLRIDETKSEVKKNEMIINLTAKEFQLLLFLAQYPNRIISKKKLYEAIWGEDYLGDDNTIMVHIRHLREKLEEDPGNPKCLITVKGLGYKMVERGEKK